MTTGTGGSALSQAAEDIARGHTVSRERPKRVAPLVELSLLSPWLERVERELVLHGAELDHEVRAVEWFLDNAYVVGRTIRQVREDMPWSFYRQLPALETTGEPRIYALAREFVTLSDLQTDPRRLARFVHAYESVEPLRVGELWALPTMLRLCSLEVITSALATLVPAAGAAPFSTEAPRLNLDVTDRITRAIVEMRTLARIDWKQLFLSTSVVERALHRDPAEVYARMEFETCDRYRKVIERLARRTGLTEVDVAQRAVARAAREPEPRGRRGHVGYFLIDEGREDFERDLGYRPTAKERAQRLVFKHASGCYFAALGVAIGVAMSIPAFLLSAFGAGPWLLAAGVLVALLPGTTLAVTAVQWLITNALPPRVLPKLDFHKRIPPDCRTAVVIPTLLGSSDDVKHLLRQLELHRLCNPDPQLRFALLTDLLDAPSQHKPDDEELVAAAREGIRELNRRHAPDGNGPFHLLHRERRWNAAEACWMGWERKRGKLEEFNRLLLDESRTGFALHEGDEDGLKGVRFVITLDSDTVLPRGVANRLVSILAHPLNRAEMNAATGRVRAGYTVIQPRVEIAPGLEEATRFTRVYGGDAEIDIYTRAVSDVYQDLFGCALYVGKGLYDVEAFARSLEGRAPENAIVSHDLWEGLHGRVALAADVVLYEDYPPHYLAFVRRMHRWIRGDWQLLPWLRRRVPVAGGAHGANRFSGLDLLKIVDNLRRSLLSPSLLLFLVSGWLWMPGRPFFWTLLGVLAPAGHLFTGLVSGLARGRRRAVRLPALRGVAHALRRSAARWLLYLVFLPFEATVACAAILKSLVRVLVVRRHLLEWRSASHTARLFGMQTRRTGTWIAMAVAPLIAVGLIVALAIVRPHALPAAAPLLLAWLVSPEIARFISEPPRRRAALGHTETAKLRHVARRTWLFFETFVGPDEQWLPPDNFQEEPGGVLAHRTSPTNIGMMLVSTLAALDLGFVTLTDLSFRLRSSLASMARLPRYRGHVLNWYNTHTLEPLLPEYVSTVDSGNLAAALLTLAQGCRDAVEDPVLRTEQWDGLLDELALFEATMEQLFAGETDESLADLREGLSELRRRLEESCQSPHTWARRLADLRGEEHAVRDLERLLLAVLAIGAGRRDPDQLHELRTWLDRFHRHLRGMQRELRLLMPWVGVLQDWPEALDRLVSRENRAEWDRQLEEALPAGLSLAAIPEACERARPLLDRVRGWVEEARASGTARAECTRWLDEMEEALAAGTAMARTLRGELLAIADTARSEVLAMDFDLLYDADQHLLHIGYNVTADRLDANHYDLLASEARLASFLAIAKGDVELLHWFHLGRPVTRADGDLCLLSWGATMFEYLMPTIFMISGESTLLARSERAATDEQIRYGERRGVPWGISESGFFRFDADQNYQYRSFGVPGLGLRRGLEDDLVVAPYASMLGLATRPHATLQNLERFDAAGAIGHFGLYETLDYTADRVAEGAKFRTVHSYMAHHQGMILAAIDNALQDDIMRRRFHGDALVQTAAQLLHESVPLVPKVEFPQRVMAEAPEPRRAGPVQLGAWSPACCGAVPEVLALGNGRLTTLITDGGGGGLRWSEWNLTRWVPDATRDNMGFWIYLRDEESSEVWSATRQPVGAAPGDCRVTFHAHMAEFHRRDQGISLRTEIGVAPSEDVEIRRVTLTNETARTRRVTLVSHADVSLDFDQRFERHPAFSRLFVESASLPEPNALLFRRRSSASDERPPLLLHRMVSSGTAVEVSGFETSREHFVGRPGRERVPRALREGLQGHAGATLDPVAALAASIELPPHATEQVAFVTIAGATRSAVLETMRRFETPDALGWALNMAYAECCREASLLGLQSAELPLAQRLLSRLLHPAAPACVPAEDVAANRIGQSRLWGMGISGDTPLLLLHMHESGNELLASQVLRMHHLWRRRGIGVDVVFVQHVVSSYDDQALSNLRRLVAREGAQEWLGRPGGIFLMRADQTSAADRRLLEVIARIVLDSRAGDLARQLPEAEAEAAVLQPSFAATSPPGAIQPPVPRPVDLLHDNGIGGFTPDGREYVIHLEPGRITPAPWCNVLANPQFGSLLTESGGGYTWALNSGENRLTPWTNDPVLDPPGEALYLRDELTAEVWTTTRLPAGSNAICQVRHGAGYTEFRQHSQGLEQRMRVFVAATDPVKIVRLSLRDTWNRPRRITATYYAEWVLGRRRAESVRFIVPDYDPLHRMLLARSSWNAEFGERVAFLASDRPPHGFTTDRAEFVGREGDLARPVALTRVGLSGEVRVGRDPCAALQVHVDIEPGGEEVLHFVLGEGDDTGHTHDLVTRYRHPAAVEAAWHELEAHWDERLGAVQVRTPEPAMDLLLNRWLLYQAISSRLLGRTGFYQSSGAFGFRDQLQDAMALVHVDPAQLRQHLLECARHQFEAGDVLHWWHPPAGRGVRTRCSDDMLWLPWVAAFYVEATGDSGVLDEEVPFLAGEPLGEKEHQRYEQFAATRDTASLFEHCRRSIEHGVKEGERGLPLIGDGDWNDGMDRVGRKGRGESVWLAWFILSTVDGFARLCDRRGEGELGAMWRERADAIGRAVERTSWDGAWYRRAYDDDGHPLGSAGEDECQIDSIAQSWSVLCGAADPARAAQALHSAEERLVRERDRVACLLWPPFDHTARDPGYIKAYPPGIRENGGQYSHAAVWLAWAFARRGDGERAERLFRLMNPILHARSAEEVERYRVEPYVIAADVAGAPPHVGRGGWTWYTGSASWAWRLGVEAILGLQRVGGRLRIDPCLPPAWEEFEAHVRGPHGSLRVHVANAAGAGRGVAAMEVDGIPVASNEVAFPEGGGERHVRVWLGKSRRGAPRDAPS
ncbi:MAG: GH36-type glycosyl hydrolase domain-containing protein [Planctomycetota bacterium]